MLFAMTGPSTLGKEDCVFRLTFTVSKFVHLSLLQPKWQRFHKVALDDAWVSLLS